MTKRRKHVQTGEILDQRDAAMLRGWASSPEPCMARGEAVEEGAQMTITEESLECTACPWVGTEADAVERDTEDGTEYDCPVCGEECAHFPLDEIGDTVREGRHV